MAIIARHLTITGRVQGVFFRAWTVETGTKLGLAGWVCNRADGSVEALVQGDETIVAAFLEQVRVGPSRARVEDVAVSDHPLGDFTTFEKRGTI